jgi:hypothetical protein
MGKSGGEGQTEGGSEEQTLSSSEMLVSTYKSTRNHNPKKKCHPHHCENLISHKLIT